MSSSRPKPAPLKPSKYWAVVNRDGEIADSGYDRRRAIPALFWTRRELTDWWRLRKLPGDRVARVEIAERRRLI